jgi:hypothetical protein
MANEVQTVFGTVSISNQLLNDRIDIEALILDQLLHPPTPEQLAARRAAKQAEWDERTAAGWVPISDYSDEGSAQWCREASPGSVERWVSAGSWARYEAALAALDDAKNHLIEWPEDTP